MPAAPTSEPFGLLSAQQSVWIADRASKDPTAFLSADLTTLPASVDPVLFVRACQVAIERTEALRLSLRGLASQVVTPGRPDAVAIPLVDLTAAPHPEAACARWTEAALRVPLDPAVGPPFAWTLLRVAPDRLLWCQIAHHAVLDATGRDLVTAAVAGIYDDLAGGRAPAAAAAAPTLAELVAAEARYLASDQYRADAAWCLGQCRDQPQAPSLSGRSTVIDMIGRRASLAVDPARTAALREIAGQLGGSLAQLLCAAWTVMLGRLSGQSDLLIGFQVAARRPVARGVPAMTTNQMPLRLSSQRGARFAELSSLTSRQCRAALRHQHYPTLHLRRALRLTPTDPDPLEIAFNFLPRRDAATIGGVPLVTHNLSHGPVRDLSLAVQEDAGGGLHIELDANRDRYSAGDTQTLVERLALLLQSVAERPADAASILVDELPIMTATERERVAVAFGTAGEASAPTTIAAMLAEASARTPDAIALHVGGSRLDYRALAGRAHQLGRHLLDQGVGPGDVVGLALPRTEDLVVAVMACMLAGIAVCPLDLAHPPARQADMLAQCGARLVLGLAGAAERLGTLAVLAIDLPRTLASLAAQPADPLAMRPTGDATAYIAFTSGSTGRPKGVAITQAAIAHQVRSLSVHLPLGVGDTVLCATTLTFDVGLMDLFLALTSGAALHLLREQEMRDPAAIRDAALAHASPLLEATPSVWRSLPLEALPAGMRAVLGGEPFPVDLLPRLRRLRGVFNVYGPTETTVWATLHRVGGDADPTLPVPVGRPLAGNRLWILGPDDQPMPIGGIGELCIGGAAVAAGYLGQPELTRAAFVAAPDGGGPMYRTGDLARWRRDGVVELLGRRDGQIKIAGHRIELSEIDHALLDLPWVAQAVTVAQGDAARRRLIAYVVPAPTRPAPDRAGLRAQLATRLPPWMLPAELVLLATMPRTANGKIDRHALPTPTRDAAGATAPPAASPHETLLRDAFARVTGRASVSADDDFFDIGGDSLAAMILLTELSQAGLDVGLPMLLDQRTPRGIANALDAPPEPTPRSADGTAIFLIPGIGGDNPDLARFRAECAGGLRFVLLDYPDWARLLAPGFDMTDLIGDFAARVRGLAPSGPVLLAGYSLGGVVAVATASALRELGEDVAGLLLFDLRMIRPAVPFVPSGNPLIRAATALAAIVRDVADGDAARTLGPSIARRLVRRPTLLRRLVGLRGVRLPPRWRYWVRFQLCVELQAKVVEPWRRAGLSNAMRLTGVRTILFRAAGVASAAASDPGWKIQRVDLHVIEVAGDHYSMLRQRGDGSLCTLLASVVADLTRETRAPDDQATIGGLAGRGGVASGRSN